MKSDTIIKLLQALGCKNVHSAGYWVTVGCPLAPFLHKNHKDHNPSFGVKINDSGPSHFNCFSCVSGSMDVLINTLHYHVSRADAYHHTIDFKTARAIINDEDLDIATLPEFSEFGHTDHKLFEEWPEWWLDQFMDVAFHAPAMDYLMARDQPVTMEQAKHHRLLFDMKRKMVICPYWNVYGKFAGARGRCIDPTMPKAWQHFDYTWDKVNNASLVWYNEQALNMEGPVIIVEGQFDCLQVARTHQKVIANLTAKPSGDKMKKLMEVDQVLLMLDHDTTGDMATEKYLQYFKNTPVSVGVIDYPKQYKDPGSVPIDVLWKVLDFPLPV